MHASPSFLPCVSACDDGGVPPRCLRSPGKSQRVLRRRRGADLSSSLRPSPHLSLTHFVFLVVLLLLFLLLALAESCLLEGVVKNSKAFGARRVEVLRGGALENGAHWSHGGDTSCGTALASYFPHARVPFGLLFLVDLGIGQEF